MNTIWASVCGIVSEMMIINSRGADDTHKKCAFVYLTHTGWVRKRSAVSVNIREQRCVCEPIFDSYEADIVCALALALILCSNTCIRGAVSFAFFRNSSSR